MAKHRAHVIELGRHFHRAVELVLIEGADDACRSFRSQGIAFVAAAEAVHLLVDHIGAVVFAGKDGGRFEIRRANLMVAVQTAFLADQGFGFMPAADLIRQNVIRASWSLIIHEWILLTEK